MWTDARGGQGTGRQRNRGTSRVLLRPRIVGSLTSHKSRSRRMRWRAVLAVLFAAVVPMAYILVGVRRRPLSDRHVGVRDERPLPLLVGVASVLVGVGSLVVLQAPRELVALEAAMAVGFGTSLLVALVRKISIHVAVAAGAVVILVLVFGPAWLLLVPLIAAVGWARVVLNDHSPAQSVAGRSSVASWQRPFFLLFGR